MKAINFVVSAVVTITLLAPIGVGFAQSSVDLGTDGSGLLPSNPFYFLKEWGRGFRKLMTFNAIRKAELELDVLNEKAAELKKLEEITPENVEALIGAFDNYKIAADGLRLRLETLKENSQNPNIDRLLTQLTERGFKHQQLFNDLEEKFSAEDRLTEGLSELKDKLAETLAAGFAALDSPEGFRSRLKSALEIRGESFNELRAAEFIGRLEEKFSGDLQKEASSLKDDLLIKFSGRLQARPALLENLPGEPIHGLELIDEVRERVSDSDLKSELNVARQRVLDQAAEDKKIGQAEAENAIESARELISAVSVPTRSSVKELLERAKFNLSQAEKLFEEGNYGGAFGQATAASAAAKNALAQLTPDAADNSQVFEAIKGEYDSLVAQAKNLNLTKEKQPKLFALLADAEKRIVDLTRLTEKKALTETIAASLRNIKFILATAAELIRNEKSNPKP